MRIHLTLRSLLPVGLHYRVILLTLLLLPGCAILGRRYGEQCNTRAWVRTDLEGFITTRFGSGTPVRLAIVPFVTPANVAARSDELPGLGNQLAWAVQRELIATEVFPIAEILN